MPYTSTAVPFTMEELEPMTSQDIFDNCARHLFRQGKQSQVSTGALMRQCLYRGPNGTMCAAGIFIPEDVYTSRMDEASLYIGSLGSSKSQHDTWARRYLGLLVALQRVHDTHSLWITTPHMRCALATVAENYGLTTATLYTLSFADR